MTIRALLLFLALLPALAAADELPGYPGWSISEVLPEDIGASDEGVSYSSQTFFTLKPPDSRPAITLNVRTAQRLRAGEIGPEAAYTGSNGAEKSEKKEEEEKKSSPASSYAWNGKGFSAIPSNSSGSSSGGSSSGGVNGFAGLPSTPIGAGPTVNPHANLGLGGSSVPASSAGASTSGAIAATDPNGIGPVKALNSKVGEVTMAGGTPVVTACAAITFENCKLNGGTSGQAAAGTCATGMTGSCSYTCTNAVWTKVSNSCSSPAAQNCYGRGMGGGYYGDKGCKQGEGPYSPPVHR